jgi:hypothetical protein
MAICRWTFCVATFVLASASASADEVCRPVTPERIETQWSYYKSQPAVEAVQGGGDGYECITFSNAEAKETKIVCRTRPVHPAHPAIVVQIIFEKDGAVYMGLQGSAAGDCNEFLKMMDAFKKKNENLRQGFSKGP